MSSDERAAVNPGIVIDALEILRNATAEAARLGQLPRWKAAFVSSSPETPLLVQWLGRTGVYFYIVGFRKGDAVTARLRMNAHTGKYAEAIAIDKAGDALMPYATPERARKRVESTLTVSSSGRTPIVVLEPFLVWKPCRESLSAFLPFYLLRVRKREQYYRVDGKLFDQLTFGAGQ